ncbi:MliC family protein [Aeromonas enteropelogenes]|uniref:MliC family protein n=1 Tax=Aeromonas enteropelogenes TaxID=29489 RepID=UPI003989709B
MRRISLFTTSALAFALLTGCAQNGTLVATGGEPVNYLCEQGKKVQVRYFTLSDQSLDFIKLALPDGKDYTLPQAVSASGARYSDEFQAVWWNKGEEGFVELRDPQGEWQIAYRECKQQ